MKDLALCLVNNANQYHKLLFVTRQHRSNEKRFRRHIAAFVLVEAQDQAAKFATKYDAADREEATTELCAHMLRVSDEFRETDPEGYAAACQKGERAWLT